METGKKLLDVDLGNIFLKNGNPQGTKNKKVGKWDFIKLKGLCTAKEAISRVKRQLTEQKNISAIHISDKELTFKICQELNSKKKSNLIIK